jgi:hypothetical protein
MYVPRSELVEISATTPYPKAIAPLLPVLCKQRRRNSAA